MVKTKMAMRQFEQEIASLREKYPSLLNANYLIQEVSIFERYLSKHPELKSSTKTATAPNTLANSVRFLLLTGSENYSKYKKSPLFKGWSAQEINLAIKQKKSIPDEVKNTFVDYSEYKKIARRS